MGGWDPKRIVSQSEITTEMLCDLCVFVLKAPKQCKICKIPHCTSCLNNKLICACGNTFVDCPKPFQTAINSLRIRCTNSEAGCQFESPIKDIAKHESACEFVITKICPNEGCKKSMKLPDFNAHINTCDFKKLECPKGCGKVLTNKEAKSHNCVEWLKECLEAEKSQRKKNEEKLEATQKEMLGKIEDFEDLRQNNDITMNQLIDRIEDSEEEFRKLVEDRSFELSKMTEFADTNVNQSKDKDLEKLEGFLKFTEDEMSGFRTKIHEGIEEFAQISRREFLSFQTKLLTNFGELSSPVHSPNKSTNNSTVSKSRTSVQSKSPVGNKI